MKKVEPPFEERTGLKPEVREHNQGWFERFAAIESAVQSIPLLILVWGPGQGRSLKRYEKRMQVVEHLRGINANNTVSTSESLDTDFPNMAKMFPDPIQREEIQAREADAIFVLLFAAGQTGVQYELSMLNDRKLAHKAILFMPQQWSDSSMLATAVREFPDHLKRKLSVSQFQQCEIIRSTCEEKLQQLRAQRHLAAVRREKI